MNFAKRNKSVVDFLFILALFGAFAITALFVVLFGARIYKSTVSNMDTNYEKRTAMSYITEKMRSHDYTGGAEVSDENSVLKLYQNIDDRSYVTYLFLKDGYLKEFTAECFLWLLCCCHCGYRSFFCLFRNFGNCRI